MSLLQDHDGHGSNSHEAHTGPNAHSVGRCRGCRRAGRSRSRTRQVEGVGDGGRRRGAGRRNSRVGGVTARLLQNREADLARELGGLCLE